MTELASGWTLAKVGDLGRAEYGQALRAVERNESGNVPVYGSAGIVGHHTEALVAGPVLVVGRKGNAGACFVSIGPCWPIDTTYFIRVPDEIDARFLGYQLAAAALGSYDSSTAIPSLRRPDLEAQTVAIAPLAEQRRIVAAIEEHLSRLEAACSSLTRVQRLLERWRFATLAVLARHRAPQRRIGDVARVGSGATPKRDRPEYWAGGDVPWVTSGQLTRPFVTEPAALITQKALLETSCRVWPKGTLLVALYGEGKTRGHCSELLIDAATNQACAAIQIHDPDVDRAFLKLYFNATYQANRSLSAGGVQPNLSLGLIKDMTFPCPPVTEQRAIVARIEEELAHADHLGLAVAEALGKSAGLRRSILAQAFRGELVAREPSDEPANLLLDRIAAARTARPAPGRKRRVRASA